MSTSAVKAMRSRTDEFMERYARLLKWAQKIPDADRDLAEDIVHEAFLQFTQSGADHISINNFDQYLREVLRNAHRTHLRQSTPRRFQQLSAIAPDAAEALMSDADPRELLQARDMLGAICLYSCWRKETSIASSVLLLRFFHGYYPNEVAKLACKTRNAIDALLKSARRDLGIYLINQKSGEPRRARTESSAPLSEQRAHLAPDIVAELRRIIFAARKGQCFQPQQLLATYAGGEAKVSRSLLSHLVSCPRCLDAANDILGLPALRHRSPVDFLGKESEVTKDA
ncbi:MAG: sigma-70 family RNA polymerase sigma factor [Rubrivivax sp.]|nr:sigma-70 family RNA polymerase sigma factor [Pyrinomonadaceae bacterium]